MPHLIIKFSKAFKVFLKDRHCDDGIPYELNRRAPVKDIFESFGVPHTEIGEIFNGDERIDFTFFPENDGDFCVRPILPPFVVTQSSFLRPNPLQAVRFVADANVGKLAMLLRVLGFDTVYAPDISDNRIASFAATQGRIVLSKDLGLLKRKSIEYGRFVRASHPDEQLIEIVDFFGLSGPFDIFSRCLRCNSELVSVPKKSILHRLEPKTKKYFHHFNICPLCDRVYWKGSHHEHMHKRLHQAGIPVLTE